uniref:Uncharacterized protein n=1 Tax=Acrobeloides nanus TaxID=290746 RepID=A0A914DML3_9BILA
MDVLRYLHNRKRKIERKEATIDEAFSSQSSAPELCRKLPSTSNLQNTERLMPSDSRDLFELSPEDAERIEQEVVPNVDEDSIELFSQESIKKSPMRPIDPTIEEECCPETPPSQLPIYIMEISETPPMTPYRKIEDPDLSELIEHPDGNEDSLDEARLIEQTPPPRKRQPRKKLLKPVGFGLDLTLRLRKRQADNNFWKAEKSEQVEQTSTSTPFNPILRSNERLFVVKKCVSAWGISLMETNESKKTFIATRTENAANPGMRIFMKDPMVEIEVGKNPQTSEQILVGANMIKQ